MTVLDAPLQLVLSVVHVTVSESAISILYAVNASPFELGADHEILIPPVVASIDVVGVST